jgi:signal transduction histidine kinase
MKGLPIGVIVVFRDVTKLRELDQMKNSFLSVAAHQLRTPLGSMRWSMELLMSGDFGKLPKTAKEAVQQIYDNSVRMTTLVNDLLDVSRIDSERGREEKKSVDIVALLHEVIHTMESEAKKRSVKIIFQEPKESIPPILMPAKHLYEALENLISNGIKYNREKGTLTILLKKEKQSILLSIADTGIGIPQADTSKIFSKFFRATNAVLKETEGSGLGLSVVKSYLEEGQARVSFESTEGVGTTFFVEFPLDAVGMPQ